MAQTIDALPWRYSQRVLCSYVNSTNQIQIARITNIPDWYFEKVVFPGERLFFEAISEAELEIYTSEVASAVLADKVTCDRLIVSTSEACPKDIGMLMS